MGLNTVNMKCVLALLLFGAAMAASEAYYGYGGYGRGYGGYGGYGYGRGYGGYGGYYRGKRSADAEPEAEPTAVAEADAEAAPWYGYGGYGLGYGGYYRGKRSADAEAQPWYGYGGYGYGRGYGGYGYGLWWIRWIWPILGLDHIHESNSDTKFCHYERTHLYKQFNSYKVSVFILKHRFRKDKQRERVLIWPLIGS